MLIQLGHALISRLKAFIITIAFASLIASIATHDWFEPDHMSAIWWERCFLLFDLRFRKWRDCRWKAIIIFFFYELWSEAIFFNFWGDIASIALLYFVRSLHYGGIKLVNTHLRVTILATAAVLLDCTQGIRLWWAIIIKSWSAFREDGILSNAVFK
jgi:hypothetical protein